MTYLQSQRRQPCEQAPRRVTEVLPLPWARYGSLQLSPNIVHIVHSQLACRPHKGTKPRQRQPDLVQSVWIKWQCETSRRKVWPACLIQMHACHNAACTHMHAHCTKPRDGNGTPEDSIGGSSDRYISANSRFQGLGCGGWWWSRTSGHMWQRTQRQARMHEPRSMHAAAGLRRCMFKPRAVGGCVPTSAALLKPCAHAYTHRVKNKTDTMTMTMAMACVV